MTPRKLEEEVTMLAPEPPKFLPRLELSNVFPPLSFASLFPPLSACLCALPTGAYLHALPASDFPRRISTVQAVRHLATDRSRDTQACTTCVASSIYRRESDKRRSQNCQAARRNHHKTTRWVSVSGLLVAFHITVFAPRDLISTHVGAYCSVCIIRLLLTSCTRRYIREYIRPLQWQQGLLTSMTTSGSVVDNYTKHHLSKLSYRMPLSCMFVVPVLLATSLFFVPESPRWHLHHDNPDAACKSLERLRSDRGDQLELEWAESFFIGYQTHFLTIAGITKAFEYTIMNTCIGFIGLHVGLFSLKKLCGRRTVMIVGAISCGLCQLASGIASSAAPRPVATGNVLVAFTDLFNCCYNAGVGAASTPLVTEVVGSRLRASIVGSANALGYFLSWLVGFCSPYFISPQDLNWGPQYSYIWAVSNFIFVVSWDESAVVRGA
ncbi:hypothetical protein EK21DRAFT_92675 [Setomelanomma holmii]|uniref:Major facilitator superfamily (MFS) profile domain-containing protein n=1 Tax=Setomelanomma holmii TaxID=210430 RepID=A0A9P4H2I1_9PLEO|nr:hypothetical protein EK21DRAFT_92675 [Setomelanomma holmii]